MLWKTMMEKKVLCENMGKTKFIVSDISLDLLKKARKGSLWHLSDRRR